MAREPVLGTEDLRRDLAQVLTRMTTQPGYTVVIGRQRKPEAVLVPYELWRELSGDGGGSDVETREVPSGQLLAGGDLSWDPADGVAYEVAESVLGDLISHASSNLWGATHEPAPDPEDVARWEEMLSGYVSERRSLSLNDPGKLRAVIEVRGAELRELTGRRRG